MYAVGIIGLGFVGSALFKSFKIKQIKTLAYDKYKESDKLEELVSENLSFIFLCLPTPFSDKTKEYDISAILETCEYLEASKYKGLVVIKSTILPETTDKLSKKFRLNFCHNPEFLTARTAFEDFHNQKHIVLGYGNCVSVKIEDFYSYHYPEAVISVCKAVESESMKLYCNSFYASKIMLFNEFYLLSKKNGSDFKKIQSLMLKNKWINPMHTLVPGTDEKLGFGGSCFPKDISALCNYMKGKDSEHEVIESAINENSKIRDN